MYLYPIVLTVIAWVAGLYLDANIDFNPVGFLSFRIFLPVLVMGCCIIKSIETKKNESK